MITVTTPTNPNDGSVNLLTIIIIVVISVCVMLFIILVIIVTVFCVRRCINKGESNRRQTIGSRDQSTQSERYSTSRSVTFSSSRHDNSQQTRSVTSVRTASYQTVCEESRSTNQGYGFSNSLALIDARSSQTKFNADSEHESENSNLGDNYHFVRHSTYTAGSSLKSAAAQQPVYDEPAFDETDDPASYYLLGQSTNDYTYSCARIVEENKKENIYKRLRPYALPSHKELEIYSQLKSFGICNISHQDIQTTGHLGSGQFGNVEKGIWKNPINCREIEVALKTLNVGSSKEDKVRFLREAAIMAQFRHPNVILLFGVASQEEPMTIVVELAHKGDLRKYLTDVNSSPTKRTSVNLPSLLLNFSQQVALGMQYLSGKGFVHRDLAARNILLSNDNTCKVADFGMARDLADEVYYIAKGGKIPVKWTAPEAINYKTYSTASDVWSYGCLLYEIWSLGKKPFDTMRNLSVVKLLGKGMRLSPPPGCPKLIYELMIRCWHPDKSKRPTFRNVFLSLFENDEVLLIPQSALATHNHAGTLGAPIEAGERMYLELRRTYETSKFDYTSLPSNSNNTM